MRKKLAESKDPVVQESLEKARIIRENSLWESAASDKMNQFDLRNKYRKALRMELKAAEKAQPDQTFQEIFGEAEDFVADRVKEWHAQGEPLVRIAPLWPGPFVFPAVFLTILAVIFGVLYLLINIGSVPLPVLVPTCLGTAFIPTIFIILNDLKRSSTQYLGASLWALTTAGSALAMAKFWPESVYASGWWIVGLFGLGLLSTAVQFGCIIGGEYPARRRGNEKWVKETRKILHDSGYCDAEELNVLIDDAQAKAAGKDLHDVHGTPVEFCSRHLFDRYNARETPKLSHLVQRRDIPASPVRLDSIAAIGASFGGAVPLMLAFHPGVGGSHGMFYAAIGLGLFGFEFLLSFIKVPSEDAPKN